jgi:DNA-binding MarR family transcriptional regulator
MPKTRADLWEVVRQLHSNVEPTIERAMTESVGLSLTAFYVLRVVNSASEGLSVSELVLAVPATRTRVSRRLDELVTADLISRQVNPGDKRSFVLKPTAEGRRLAREGEAVYRSAIASVFGDSPLVGDISKTVDVLQELGTLTQPVTAR